ncbi:MAG TPA: Ig-like domain-containing protein [Gemmatimonadales bacterium]
MSFRPWKAGALLSPLVLATACGGEGSVIENPVAVRLGIAVAPPATAQSGVPFATSPVVQLLDANGEPVAQASVPVTASVQGGSVIGTASVRTGSDGRAVFSDLALGGAPGARTLVFSSGTLQAASHAMSLAAGPAARLAANSALTQPALASSAVAIPPSVKVTDAGGNAVAGFSVQFAVASGGGTLVDPLRVTGADGVATLGSWTLGPVTGANSVTATAAGLEGSPVTFTANGVALMPTLMAREAPQDQAGQVNGQVPVAPSVRVTGLGGAPVPGVTVQFVVISGGGALAEALPITDASGIASVGSWTLGSVGENQVNALLPGVAGSPTVFRATATQSGTVTAIPTDAVGVVGAAVTPPGVLVRNGSGAPLAGIAVAFEVASGGGTVQGAEKVTGADGRAFVGGWTLGPAAGIQELRATVPPGYGGSPVLFSVQAVGSAPSSIAIAAGNGQTARVASAVPVRPAVRVTDAGGQPVAGYPVTFAPSQGHVTGGSALTDANGVATVGSWTLAEAAGSQSLTAASSVGNVQFTATATAGPATRFARVGSFTGQVGGFATGAGAGIRSTDDWNNPVGGVPVTFAVFDGPGSSVDGAVQVTNGSGFAAPVNWKLGTTSGQYAVSVTSPGLETGLLFAQATAGPATQITMFSGDGQTGGVRRLLPASPTVRVADQYGNQSSGSVTFAVTGGGGSGGGTVPTAETGLASVKWKLGSDPGTNHMRATLDGTASTYEFTATATPVSSDFRIDVRFISAVTPAQEAVFTAAAARWTDIILGDIPGMNVNLAAGACFPSQPAIQEAVDDVVIFVDLTPIDGVGGVLGSAGPCALRLSSLLPGVGALLLDVADVNDMLARGELADVVAHEMGHVLGVGSLWELKNLTSNEGTASVSYHGTAGVNNYHAIGGQLSTVPVENSGGQGTADSHWRESVFSNELMTGYIFTAGNPLTRMTIGSVQDLGYPAIDYGTADSLSFRPQLRTTSALRPLGEVPLRSPIRIVDDLGRIVAERPRVR